MPNSQAVIKKKIVIVCYTFPPSPGIGGRRWAKFAKYFDRLGNDIKIVSAKNYTDKKSEWTADVAGIQAHVKEFSSSYPQILQEHPKTVLEKIKYRLALFFVKTFSDGSYYDRSFFLEKSHIEYIRTLIKNGYDNVIVSVGPYHYSYEVVKLKKEFPGVNFILDVRDAWTENKNLFGFSGLSEGRRIKEEQKENYVIQNFDHVISVKKSILDFFRKTHPNKNYTVIPNGFDPDDVSVVNNESPQGSKLKIVYAGSLYKQAENKLIELISALKKADPAILKDVEFHFYGNIRPEIKKLFDTDLPIFYDGIVPVKEIHGHIKSSNVCLLLLTDENPDAFSTKFYEYISFKKPIWVISKVGDTGDFIKNNSIGFHCETDGIAAEIIKIHSLWKKEQLNFDPGFDVKQFGVDFLASKVLDLAK